MKVAKGSGGGWITINGTHVMIDGSGTVVHGPSALKSGSGGSSDKKSSNKKSSEKSKSPKKKLTDSQLEELTWQYEDGFISKKEFDTAKKIEWNIDDGDIGMIFECKPHSLKLGDIESISYSKREENAYDMVMKDGSTRTYSWDVDDPYAKFKPVN
ncbi:MAG: hypothetical protein IKY67_06310 [Paludibacteraceae bacterium]|nr:hypothetical protein [Paludibacteraceae bacterium]